VISRGTHATLRSIRAADVRTARHMNTARRLMPNIIEHATTKLWEVAAPYRTTNDTIDARCRDSPSTPMFGCAPGSQRPCQRRSCGLDQLRPNRLPQLEDETRTIDR